MNTEIRQLLIDRYDIEELIELLNPSVEDLLDKFEDEIDELYREGSLDI